jgi:hypothetical protein
MEGSNPLLESTSDSSSTSDSDVEGDDDPEAAAVVAGRVQWSPVTVTDECTVLLTPIDIEQLQRCGYCRPTAAPRSSFEGACSAVVTYWRSDEALLHLQPWRLLEEKPSPDEPEPEPEPNTLDPKYPLEWSRALWTQPAHTRSQGRGGPGGGVASALGRPSGARIAQVISAAGQQLCHRTAALVEGRDNAQGYASHVQIDRTMRAPPAHPLLVLERPAQTGSVCWGCARVFRRWALANPAKLLRACSSGSTCRFLELGAGVGLLGISLAVDFGADVVMTDFDGHFFSSLFGEDPDESVLALLSHNAAANAALVEASGGQLRVKALDWSAPSTVRNVWPPGSASSAPADGADGAAMPLADVIVGTELVYTAGSASLLCNTVRTWLRPGGVFFLLQAQNRVDMSRFEGLANESGLNVEEIDVGEAVRASSEMASAAPGAFRMIAVTWKD